MASGPLIRVFPALAILLVPLALLAWLGSSELGRLQERAEAGLRGQADVLAREVARRIELTVAEWERTLDAPVETVGESLVALTAERRRFDGRIDLLGLLDDGGQSLFPRPAPAWPESLPFLEPSRSEAVRDAELLETLGDTAGARSRLQLALETGDDRSRALFVLGGLDRAAGDVEAARRNYAAAALEAEVEGRADAGTVIALCDAARAEIAAELEGDHEPLLELVEGVAHGSYDTAADEVLAGLLERATARLPDDVEALARVATATELDACRRDGRRFAATYTEFLGETVRRRLRDAPLAERISVVDIAGDDSSMLLLRRLSSDERNVVDPLAPGAAWLFLRFDLDALLESITAPSDEATEAFRIAVRTATASWPEDAGTDPAIATSPTGVGMLVEARAQDAPRALAERRRTAQNRAILVLALALSAAGGALLLLRTVSRERELLATRVGLVSRVTHELKTPLALIRMYAETLGLGRTRDDEQRRRFADVIVREADGLTRLVERFLDFSSQQAGRLRYSPQHLDAAARIRSLVEHYRPHVESRGGRLELDSPEHLELAVDPDGLENAVVNLIENAVKYTPPDAPDRTVEVTLAVDGDIARITVADRGIGVPAAERDQVFRGFHRGSNAGEIRGAGLGLQLVRHFAREHGGDARAYPRDGGGSVFQIRLPTPKGPRPATTPREPGPTDAAAAADSP